MEQEGRVEKVSRGGVEGDCYIQNALQTLFKNLIEVFFLSNSGEKTFI